MIPHKLFFTILILFSSFQICFGQNKPQAFLIGEDGEASCEQTIAQVDNLLIELQNEPTSTGYIVIYGKKGDFSKGLGRETTIRGQLEFREKHSSGRLFVIRAKELDDLKVQFWKVPDGAEKPNFEETEWNFTLPADKKSFRFNTSGYDDGVCPIGYQFKIYSDFLKANNNVRGHIVIFAKTKREFQKEKVIFSNGLVNKYGVSPNKLKFFFILKKIEYTEFEMWFVPKNK